MQQPNTPETVEQDLQEVAMVLEIFGQLALRMASRLAAEGLLKGIRRVWRCWQTPQKRFAKELRKCLQAGQDAFFKALPSLVHDERGQAALQEWLAQDEQAEACLQRLVMDTEQPDDLETLTQGFRQTGWLPSGLGATAADVDRAWQAFAQAVTIQRAECPILEKVVAEQSRKQSVEAEKRTAEASVVVAGEAAIANVRLERLDTRLERICRNTDILANQAPCTNEKDCLKNYLCAVLAETCRIDIQGIASHGGAGREALTFPIEQMYTPLTTANPHERPEDLQQPELRMRPERVPLTALLAARSAGKTTAGACRLLIVGDPGSGKTTFLRLIAAVLANDCQGQALAECEPSRQRYLGLSEDEPPSLPIFVRLARMVQGPDATTDTSATRLLDPLSKTFGAELRRLLEQRLDAGQAVLLLDGLDEVADTDRRTQLANLVDAALRRWGHNRIVVTSRRFGFQTVAGLTDVTTVHIDDFGDSEIRDFLQRWVNTLFGRAADQPRRRPYLQEIETAIINHPRIRQMAANPVMLTCLCVVHWNERKLPEGKADLLAAVLRWLINAKEPRRRDRGSNGTFAEECFKALAFAMTTDPQGKKAVAELDWAAQQLAVPFSNERSVTDLKQVRKDGVRMLEEETLDSGIVQRCGVGEIRFWHLTFQEHYAARALNELNDDDWWRHIAPNLDDAQWAEVLDHLAGCLAWTGRRRLNLLVEKILALARPDDLAATARAVGVLGRLLRILAVYDYQPPANLGWQDARDRAMAIFDRAGAALVPVDQRIRAAEALGRAGDPRLSSPTANMLAIPGLPCYQLGKYLVTVEDFRRFVDDGGYQRQELWDPEGWAYREKEDWKPPGSWFEPFDTPNRPVNRVSWYEATAFCQWLNHTNRLWEAGGREAVTYRLPTEDEWFAAAKHPKGDYPWGAEEPNAERANFNQNVGQPTPVGIYPSGDAPGGHCDMAGNVWEWCLDVAKVSWAPDGAVRALRGGSWSLNSDAFRPAYRFRFTADLRGADLGFRVLAAPASTVEKG